MAMLKDAYAEAKRLSDAMGFETVGEPGMDAPENVAFFIAAWLYGKDFEECLLLSNACGEDTDCTCATLGALMGIILGASGIPEKWTAPLYVDDMTPQGEVFVLTAQPWTRIFGTL